MEEGEGEEEGKIGGRKGRRKERKDEGKEGGRKGRTKERKEDGNYVRNFRHKLRKK